MNSWTLREMRVQVANGEPLATADADTLLDALDAAIRAAKIPSEFVMRVARDGDDHDRWTAHHPLLLATRSADHPADALILGAEELRRVLANLGVAEPSDRTGSAKHDRIDRHVADAHRSTADGPVAASLDWALAEIDRLTTELHDAEGRRDLLAAASSGDRAARDRLRLDAIAAFERANVNVSAATWSTDALGDASSLGLDLPTLVLAIDVARPGRFAGWRFTEDRDWFALSHRVEPRPMSRYVDRIVTPLAVSDAAALSLHRLAPRVPTGRSVVKYNEFAALIDTELPEVDVGRLDTPLSPAWVPLPTSAIPLLCAGTDDEDLDLDALVEHDGWGPWSNHWDLAWVTDREGDDSW